MLTHSLSAGIVAHVNGDFSGDVHFTIPTKDHVTEFIPISSSPVESEHLSRVIIPFSDLLELVGRYMQKRDTEKIEASTGEEYVELSLLDLPDMDEDDPHEGAPYLSVLPVPSSSPKIVRDAMHRAGLELMNQTAFPPPRIGRDTCKLEKCTFPYPHSHGTTD